MGSGPTGKEIGVYPTLSEQLRAAEIITQLVAEPPPPPELPVEAPDPIPDLELVRKALLEDIATKLPQPIEPRVDPADGGTVISISDPDEI